MCGGTRCHARFAQCAYGLSPRVRGNPDEDLDILIYERSIPACAGEPDTATRQIIVRVVYPRVCGGTAFAIPNGLNPCGLSPRVRGNLPYF